jgi:hypothetical protein
MHQPGSLVARLIQPAPENGVGVQGNSLSQVAPIETFPPPGKMRECTSRSSSTIQIILAWLMQEAPYASDSVAIGGVTAAVCIFPVNRATPLHPRVTAGKAQ